MCADPGSVLVVEGKPDVQDGCRHICESNHVTGIIVDSVAKAIEMLEKIGNVSLIIVDGCTYDDENLIDHLKELRRTAPEETRIYVFCCCHEFKQNELPKGVDLVGKDTTIGELICSKKHK